jgi:hypothetical protein
MSSPRARAMFRTATWRLLDDLEPAVPFDEDVTGAVDHDLGDLGIEDQRLDRPKKRQDDLEAHHRTPRARWAKYVSFGSR